MDHSGWLTICVYVADILIRVGFSLRVIMRRLPVGTSLAWLLVILMFPFVGAGVYLVVGEYRLGRDWTRRMRETHAFFSKWKDELSATNKLEVETLDRESSGLARLTQSVVEAAPLAGNHLQLLENAGATFPALIADIDQAQRTCHLEFYIWFPGGIADEVGKALIRAAQRGVVCRVIVDAVGSGKFLRGSLVKEMRQAGVQVQSALPVGLRQLLFVRPDLRMHRKIVVIDGAIGYTGSLNLADPRLFKQNAGVGQWVDAMTRINGPAVADLAITFLTDWATATGTAPEQLRGESISTVPGEGDAIVQVVASGPAARVKAIEQVVLMAIYGAQRELVLTTPYFVPSESMLTALLSAADRGVKVTLIVPEKVDSHLTHYAKPGSSGGVARGRCCNCLVPERSAAYQIYHGGWSSKFLRVAEPRSA